MATERRQRIRTAGTKRFEEPTMIRISHWRPGHLLAAWTTYWIALALALLGPAIGPLWRVTRPDAHGSASASVGDGMLKMIVVDGTTTVWSLDISLAALAVGIAVPPLALFGFWLRSQQKRRAEVVGDRVA
jgi:hypothetical protein